MGQWTEEDIPNRVAKPGNDSSRVGLAFGIALLLMAVVALVFLARIDSQRLDNGLSIDGVAASGPAADNSLAGHIAYETQQMERQRNGFSKMKGAPAVKAKPAAGPRPVPAPHD